MPAAIDDNPDIAEYVGREMNVIYTKNGNILSLLVVIILALIQKQEGMPLFMVLSG
jgi:hypothetical protein